MSGVAVNKPALELRIALSVGYVVFILVNVAASKGWIGPTNAQHSSKITVPITPAGWAFSIWGLIFLLQGAGVVYQAIEYGYENESKARAVEAVGYLWLAGWAFESLWQVLFQLQTRVGAWLCMFALLGGLASFALALKRVDSVETSGVVWALFSLPTSINAAWLSVASCIGIMIVAWKEGVPHLEYGTLLLAALAIAAGLFRLYSAQNAAYGLALVWAFIGIYAKQERWPVGIAAALCALICGIGSVVTLLNKKPKVLNDYMHPYSEL